jgi:hypothetical protein
MRKPVVLFIFNRPDSTAKVFEAIRQAQPPQLFIVADGPRSDHHGEKERCLKTRKIVETVDWDCTVKRNYADTNMGLRARFPSGLNWVFETVDQAIILEDDCLPHATFFDFCEENLDKYCNDSRITSITGTNMLGCWKSDIQSYHFSHYFNVWGWATWKRVWDCYDVDMSLWSNPEAQSRIKDVIADKEQYLNRKKCIDSFYYDHSTSYSWDYQLFFLCLLYSGLNVTPSINLVSNIGFGEQSTNTKDKANAASAIPTNAMNFPLIPPIGMSADREYDHQWYKNHWKIKITDVIRWKFQGLARRLEIKSKFT